MHVKTVISADSTVIDAARAWHAWFAAQEYATNTINHYRCAIECYIGRHPVSALSLRDANRVPVLEPWLHEVARDHGKASAKIAKKMMSGTIYHALRHEALDRNMMREVRMPRTGVKAKIRRRDATRSMTDAELKYVIDLARSHQLASRHDLADLVAFLAATGTRISEALGLCWGDIDVAQQTVHICGTKTMSSDRVIPLPEWVVGLLERRRRTKGVVDPAYVVFTSIRHRDPLAPRNLNSVDRDFRVLFDDAGMEWATSHTFRHTIITRLAEAGFDDGFIAQFVGHESLETTRAYIGKKRDLSALRPVLQAISDRTYLDEDSSDEFVEVRR